MLEYAPHLTTVLVAIITVAGSIAVARGGKNANTAAEQAATGETPEHRLIRMLGDALDRIEKLESEVANLRETSTLFNVALTHISDLHTGWDRGGPRPTIPHQLIGHLPEAVRLLTRRHPR